MTNRLRFVAAVLVMWAGAAFAQIELSETYERGQPIEARCACVVPDGAELAVIWQPGAGVEAREHPVPTGQYFWVDGTRKTYSVSMVAVFQFGSTITVQVKEGDEWVEREIRTSTGLDVKQYEKTFTVGKQPDGDDDDDDDDDDVVVEGDAEYVVIVEESANRTPQQNYINQQTRRTRFGLPEGRVFVVDKDGGGYSDAMESFIARSSGKQLPYIVISDKAGKVLFEGTQPAKWEEVKALVEKYQ